MNESRIQSEVQSLWAYAEFLVWVDGVDTGFIENDEAEELLAQTYECYDASEAVRLLWRNDTLYTMFIMSRVDGGF